MNLKLSFIFLAFLLATLAVPLRSQTVVLGGEGPITCPDVKTATWTTPPACVTFSNLTRGSGVTCLSAADALNGSGFTSASASAAFSANKFYTVTITAGGTPLTLMSINWLGAAVTASSTTTSYVPQYKNDGGPLTTFGTAASFNGSGNFNSTFTGSVTVAATKSIVIYLTPYGSANAGNAFSVKNGSSFTISTSPLGPPTGAASQSFCTASTVANLVATGSNIKWYNMATGGTQYNPTDPLVSGNHYYASQTVGTCESTTRLDVTATIGATAPPTGSASQSFCTASTIANLVATGTSIKWYNMATGGTQYNPTDALVSGNHYYASQTVNGCESTTRLDVTVTIGATPPPTGAASQSFCTAATIANLVATGTNIKWYNQATGGTQYNPTDALVNGNHYFASQTVGSCESTTRLDVTASVGVIQAPTGSASQSFCTASTIASLVATGSNIKWYNQATGGTQYNPTDALVNGNHYYASQTVGSCESTSRLDVTVTIGAAAPPTGSANQTFCVSSTVANLVATGTNIKWYNQATGGTQYNLTDVLVNGNHYFASQTVGGCESETRLDVTVNIGLIPAPTGNAAQSFCGASTIANLTATGTDIKWYNQATGGTQYNPTDALVNGNHYYASQTVGGCESANRLDVTVTLGASAPPTGAATQSFCNAGTVAGLVATGTNIKWYNQATGGTQYNSTDALVNGNHYFASQTEGGCESALRLDVTVAINTTAAPTGTATQSFCGAATIAGLAATGTDIKWYSAATDGTLYVATDALVNGNHYYASQTVAGCESASRLDVTADVNIVVAPSGPATQSFCGDATVADLSAAGTGIKWFNQASGGTQYTGTEALVIDNHYFASQTVNGCESTDRFDVTVVPVGPPAGLSSSDVTATSALLHWQGIPEARRYKIKLVNLTTDVATSYRVEGNLDSKLVEGLDPNTKYRWFAKTKCFKSPMSVASPWQFFTTLDGMALQGVVNNDAANSGTAPTLDATQVTIQPNPSAGNIRITATGKSFQDITITDLTGRIVWQKSGLDTSDIEIDIHALSPGLYHVHTQSGAETSVSPLVIIR